MTMIYRCVCYPRSSQWDSFNLDIDDKNILFHISVRADRGRIVMNELIEDRWGAERLLPFDPEATPVLPLSLVVTKERAHLLLGGELGVSLDTAWRGGRPLRVRASLPWLVSGAFGPFLPAGEADGADAAWLPPEGIGQEALRGFIGARGWTGGAVTLRIGEENFALRALAVPLAEDLPSGFVVPLDGAARDALARAEAEKRRPCAVSLDFGASGLARAWVNAPGVVESLREGRIGGWVRSRGALPRLELLVGGEAVPVAVGFGGDPGFPTDSVIALAGQAAEDGYEPERRQRFTLELPAALRDGGGPRRMISVLADGAGLPGGQIMIGEAEPAPPGEASAPAPEAEPMEPPAEEAPVAAGQRGGTVEVLRMDIPPGAGQDRFLDLVAPNGDIALHLRYRASENWLATNQCLDGQWGVEAVLGCLPSSWFRIIVDVEIGAGRCLIAVNHVPWGEVRSELLGADQLTVRGPHQRFARRGARNAAVPTPVRAVGAVDRIGRESLIGWVADPPEGAVLTADIGEGPVVVPLRWMELPGLAARIGRQGRAIGFAGRLPETLRGRLGRSARQARIAFGGQPLTLPMPLTSAVLEVDGFTLRGEVIGRMAQDAPVIGVLLGGRPLDVGVVTWAEAGVPAVRGDAEPQPRMAFEIELPGLIWSGLGDEDGAALDVTMDGRVMEPSRLLFTRAMARQAMAAAAQAGDATQEAQGQVLLAIEHLVLGRFLAELPEDVARFLREAARRLNLSGFLRQASDPSADAARGDPGAPALADGDRERIAIWRALRAVSQRMAGDFAPVFAVARQVEAEWGLNEADQRDAQRHFWFGLVPTLCGTDELPLLAGVVPLSSWFHHAESNDAWALSSAVALLAAGGEARRATDALYRLAKSLNGWINASCLGFALRHMERAEAAGRVPEGETERFRYAFMALLDAFKGEWFSRLHDRHFVSCMVLLLNRRRMMPDYLAKDVTSAALRHFGLAPAFWRAWMTEREVAEPPLSLLSQAEARFQTLARAMETPERVDQDLPVVVTALDFFAAQRNPEAAMWKREVLAHALRPGSLAHRATTQRLAAGLVAAEAPDAVRVLALPGSGRWVWGRKASATCCAPCARSRAAWASARNAGFASC